MLRALRFLVWAPVLLAEMAAASSWYEPMVRGVQDIWNDGRHELFVPFHTHHLRFAYSDEKIDGYQEHPVGFGYGRGKFTEDGLVRHGLFGMGFQDSHYKPSYMLGYGRQWFWRPGGGLRIGGGFTAFLMTRSDIASYWPFPGILPMASVGYRDVSLEAAYVPGGEGYGNVVFIWGRFTFDR